MNLLIEFVNDGKARNMEAISTEVVGWAEFSNLHRFGVRRRLLENNCRTLKSEETLFTDQMSRPGLMAKTPDEDMEVLSGNHSHNTNLPELDISLLLAHDG